MQTNSLPAPLGTINPTTDTALYGQVFHAMDSNKTNKGLLDSPLERIVRLCLNRSGAAGLPARIVKHKITNEGPFEAFGVVSEDKDPLALGVLDQHLPTAGCPDLSACYVVVEGATTLISSAAIAVGDPLCSAASGKVRKWLVADGADAMIGRAMTAAAGADVEIRAYVHFH